MSEKERAEVEARLLWDAITGWIYSPLDDRKVSAATYDQHVRDGIKAIATALEKYAAERADEKLEEAAKNIEVGCSCDKGLGQACSRCLNECSRCRHAEDVRRLKSMKEPQ